MAVSIMEYLHFVLPKWDQAHFFSSQPLFGFEVVCVDPNKWHGQIWMISSLGTLKYINLLIGHEQSCEIKIAKNFKEIFNIYIRLFIFLSKKVK